MNAILDAKTDEPNSAFRVYIDCDSVSQIFNYCLINNLTVINLEPNVLINPIYNSIGESTDVYQVHAINSNGNEILDYVWEDNFSELVQWIESQNFQELIRIGRYDMGFISLRELT